MVLASIYMLFGLALISMCFSLIQEEIATKFKWVGEKLGIIERDNDYEYEEEEEEKEISPHTSAETFGLDKSKSSSKPVC